VAAMRLAQDHTAALQARPLRTAMVRRTATSADSMICDIELVVSELVDQRRRPRNPRLTTST